MNEQTKEQLKRLLEIIRRDKKTQEAMEITSEIYARGYKNGFQAGYDFFQLEKTIQPVWHFSL